MTSATATPAAASCAQGSVANRKPERTGKSMQSTCNTLKRGVCKPKVPSTKQGWAAIHKEARRRAAMYYKMKAMKGQLAQINLNAKPWGKTGGFNPKMICPIVINLPLRQQAGALTKMVP